MRTPQQIKQERAAALAEIRSINEKINNAEGDDLDALDTELEAKSARIGELDAELAKALKREKMLALGDEQEEVEPRESDPLPHQTGSPENRHGQHRYSLLKALRESAEGRLSGLERETSDAIAERSSMSPRGFYLPWDLPIEGRGRQRAERRDLDATSGSGAVMTVTRPTMIDFLRNAMRVQQLGATVLTNLNGNIRLPKQTAIATATWKAAAAALAESNPTIGQVALDPNRVGTFIDYDKDLLNQTSMDVEGMVRADLALSVALAIDLAAINGSGTAPEPEGILNNSGTSTVPLGANGAVPTWGAVVDLEKEVDADNALEGSLAYLTNAKGRGKLKQSEKATGTAAFIWEELTNTVNGYTAMTSNQVPSNLTKGSGTNLSAMIFGNWASLLIGFWGGIDLIVNPYSQDINDLVRVSIRQNADIAFRHDESFSKIVDMITT